MLLQNDVLYEGGRYWLGAGHYFVEYPRMQMAYIWSKNYSINSNFYDMPELVTVSGNPITVRTQDGLRMTCDFALHYKVGLSFTNRP